MVAQYSDFTKLKHAKVLAKENGCFIVERDCGQGKFNYLVYRCCEPRNVFVGKRSSIDGLFSFVKKVVETR